MAILASAIGLEPSARWASASASFTPQNIFRRKQRRRSNQLVTNLKEAYHARIEKLDWMGDDTKKEALKKLDTYTIKVGYPDHPRDYSKLAIDARRSHRQCEALRGGRTGHSTADDFSGRSIATDWGMTPQTNDAYNGSLRDIVFPAGILQPPMFDAECRSRDQLWRGRRRDRPRTDARIRRSGPQDRCVRNVARLVDGEGRGDIQGASRGARRAVFEVRAAARRKSKRRTDDG